MAAENPNPSVSEQSKRGQAQQGTKGSQQEQKEQQGAEKQSASRQRGAQQPSASGSLARRESYAPVLPGRAFLGMTPFSLMRRMMEDLDRMFEEFGSARGLAWPSGREMERGGTLGEGLWVPPVEMFERDGHLVVRADLPGMSKDNIRVEVADDTLILEGERRQEVEEEERGGTYRSERIYGSFRRNIPLPEGVNPQNAEARFDNGVLEVSLELSPEQTRGRRIEIQEGKQAPSVH